MSNINLSLPPDVLARLLGCMEAGVPVPPDLARDLRPQFNLALAEPGPSPRLPHPRLSSVRTQPPLAYHASPPSPMVGRARSLPLLDNEASPEFLSALLEGTLPPLPALSPLPPSPSQSPSLPTNSLAPSSSYASSPTLRGEDDAYEGGIYSPTLNDDSPSQACLLSPLLLDSPSSLGKRAHSEEEDDEDSELYRAQEELHRALEELDRAREERRLRSARKSCAGLKIRIPAPGHGGEGGGGGGGGGGIPPAHLWTEDCVRRGDREPNGEDADIGRMACNQPGCRSCEGGEQEQGDDGEGQGEREKRKGNGSGKGGKRGGRPRKKARVGYCLHPEGGPAITEGAGCLLSNLLAVFGRAHRQDLEDVLTGLDGTVSSISTDAHDTRSVCARIKATTQVRVGELHLILSLVQLSLNVDSLRAEAASKGTKITFKQLAAEYAPGTHENTFRDWLSHGKRFLCLGAGGTMYIYPIIAALGLRTVVVRQVTEDDILSLASALRRVKHGMWLPMVRRLMVPIFHLRDLPHLDSLQLHHMIPRSRGDETPQQVESFSFKDIVTSDRLFDGVKTNFPILHPRSPEWNATAVPAWKPLEDPERIKLAPVHTIKTPLKYEKTPCPVDKSNRNSFTQSQRIKAANAYKPKDLDDLEASIKDIHRGGKAKSGKYVKISSDILDGKALRIEDKKGKLLSFLFTIPPEYRQQLAYAIQHIHTCMPGEFKTEDSRREFFKYLACHYSWYARYAEKGTNAPDNAHPDNVRRDHKGRVNFEQRNAHRSKDMKNVEQYAILVEAYTDFFELLRVALKEYLPDDYDELSIYVEQLPLDASSPCYPFGGFVINLSACTWAHRDAGDKRLCLVVPFGEYEGGELCLYEAGFCFDLKPGDVLIFPSCDLTHFNMHFKGLRGTLVLHSDRQGDSWVRDFHGWAAHFVYHS